MFDWLLVSASGWLTKYKAHVCRQVYADPDKAQAQRESREKAWPEYPDELVLVSIPAYLSQRDEEEPPTQHSLPTNKPLERVATESAKAWLAEYLGEHVQTLQELKQNHVHVPNAKGERVPLAHCRRADNPKLCKGDFPRKKWLIEKPAVLCPGLLRRMEMPASGRRNFIGGLHGPMNDDSLNGTHPAFLSAAPCNSDLQLPYRLPICTETHNDEECN